MSGGAILVTGVGGLLGGATARRLHAAGRRVIGMDTLPVTNLPFPVLRHDLPDPHGWHAAIARHGVDAVIHAGGISGPMVLRDTPARICAINLQGLVDLLEAARVHKLRRVVWFSSVNAYGPRASLDPVDETAALHPDTVYGATKAAGEALIEAFRTEHGVDAVALRVASCYGPGRTTACLIRTLVEDALAGRVTAVRPADHRTRQHVFVDDVISAIVAALDAPALASTAYNIGPGRAQELDEIVAAVREAVPGARAELREDGLAWNVFPLGPLSIAAAQRDLGFLPSTPLAEGARRTRAWVEMRGQA
ncbi:NAD(P)-dependent oxidoreductase [Xanthobacter flavus]|uniref:NAD-dependent epimerase/dehydratase family protein n=1 Tax=Xanthobacter flavus TaxID=281 RepID=UPI00372786DB